MWDETLILLPEVVHPVSFGVKVKLAIPPLGKLTEETVVMFGPQLSVKSPEREICPTFCMRTVDSLDIVTISNNPFEQVTVSLTAPPTVLACWLDMEVSQLPMMMATARVKAINRMLAKRGEIPFMLTINN